MKYKEIHHQAKHIDRLIDNYIIQNAVFPAQAELKNLVTSRSGDFYVLSYGWHKIVFGINSEGNRVVLKVGSRKIIENDHHVYKRVPETRRHQVLAKIFWHTKYCLLQEYGLPAHVTPAQLARIRQVVNMYGVFDIKADNLRGFGGQLKIVDANMSAIPIPRVLRLIDETKPLLPKLLVWTIKKITKPFYER